MNHRGPLPLREIHSTDETRVWRDPGGSSACLPGHNHELIYPVTQTGSVFVKQVVFLSVNHRGPLPLTELHSTGETWVWRDPGGSWACLRPVSGYEWSRPPKAITQLSDGLRVTYYHTSGQNRTKWPKSEFMYTIPEDIMIITHTLRWVSNYDSLEQSKANRYKRNSEKNLFRYDFLSVLFLNTGFPIDQHRGKRFGPSIGETQMHTRGSAWR